MKSESKPRNCSRLLQHSLCSFQHSAVPVVTEPRALGPAALSPLPATSKESGEVTGVLGSEWS